ncbi:PREDICTED: nucleolar transcription factor 1-A-like [Nicrophorus vespilloides]|uniref:Nucleolar transcription factor 1-A-like n=1 Tax=Nicrophorus vespilloides TaxID=110193 RepID=A0ABM1M4E6_NICVS|nr:PREDICTED: nucleolar transcription factor 1-A-like [Nicrophorus vespilloides]
MRTAILLAFGAVLAAQAFPHSGDTNVVESMIREVRAVAPDDLADLITKDTKKAFLHTYGDDDDNEQGYNKKVDDEGGKGYKHFDSYHKKDSDKYGFETQTAFGKGEGSETEAGSKSGKYSETKEDDGEADKSEDTEEDDADDEDEEETKHSYKVVEDVDEDGESGHYTEGSEGYNSSDFNGDDDDSESKSYHPIEADEDDEDDDDQ